MKPLAAVATLLLMAGSALAQGRHGASGTLAAETERAPASRSQQASRPSTGAASYYRFFRGVRAGSSAPQDWLARVGSELVPAASAMSGLTGYIQAVAPAAASTAIPDVFSLAAFESEREFRQARSTPEGTKFQDLQWKLFDQAKSKLGPARPFRLRLRADEPVIVVNDPSLDWRSGHTMVFAGARKSSLPRVKFLPELKKHVERVRDEMRAAGLDGYILCGTFDYEVAFLHFSSKELCEAALASPKGKELLAEAGQIFDIAMFAPAVPFTGTVAPGQAINASAPAAASPGKRGWR